MTMERDQAEDEEWQRALARAEALRRLSPRPSAAEIADAMAEFSISRATLFRWLKRFQDENRAAALLNRKSGRRRAKLAHEQNLLYAEHKHSILVVLQALDAGGKDGTIKHVFTALNPQGGSSRASSSRRRPNSRTISCGASTPTRRHKGEIAIFNRSHYEDVLVTRVHKLIDKATWTQRYRNPRLRGPARRKRNGDPQILPPHQQGGAARPLRPAPRRPGAQLEDQRSRLRRARILGRLYRGVRGRRSRNEHQRRRGTSSRRTTNGSAIWRCRRSWPTRWRTSSSPSPRRRSTSPRSGASITPRPKKEKAAKKNA